MSEFDDRGIWATDVLLDAIAVGGAVEDDFALELMMALVDDVSQDLPDLEVVAPAPVVPARTFRRLPRLAHRTSVAGAAVMVVLSTGGMAAASVKAGPTSPLFPLRKGAHGTLPARRFSAAGARDQAPAALGRGLPRGRPAGSGEA